MVYVDDEFIPYRGMLMCHMLADTTEELLEMADIIGVQRKWIQYPGTHKEHFDVCKAKRALAIQAGARSIDRHELVRLLQDKRAKK